MTEEYIKLQSVGLLEM